MRRPQIAVIGAAEADPALLAAAEELGTRLVDAGMRVVCGGRGGVMEAVSRGAHASERATGGDVIGILPSVDGTDANPWVDIVVPTGMHHMRNVLVVSAGDAVVALGGGAGTLSELVFAWKLGKPVIAFDRHGGWSAELAGRALDDRRDDAIVAVGTPEEAVRAVLAALRPS
ncbi:MAG: TIGR00725 family protein [Alphaproteobacteria bacterium]|nr:TIGR00725 family protein [Alphaproteobacteria bacterium]